MASLKKEQKLFHSAWKRIGVYQEKLAKSHSYGSKRWDLYMQRLKNARKSLRKHRRQIIRFYKRKGFDAEERYILPEDPYSNYFNYDGPYK